MTPRCVRELEALEERLADDLHAAYLANHRQQIVSIRAESEKLSARLYVLSAPHEPTRRLTFGFPTNGSPGVQIGAA